MRTDDLTLKRRSIELGHLESWLSRRRGGIYFEDLRILHRTLRLFLRVTGLRTRGETNARSIELRQVRFEFANLPKAFDGFRILHLSDLHSDGLAGLPDAICELVGGLTPDLCVLTGDYRFETYGPCHNVNFHMTRIVESVRAPFGIVGILGNHDFAEEAEALTAAGVTMLINRAIEVSKDGASIWIVGLDDPHYYGCDDLEGALGAVPDDAFKILLVHTPELIPEAEGRGIQLYLCGHTHGGQICVPGIGPIVVNARCARRFTRGRWTSGSIQGYTSSGAGSSCVPVRFFCPPEVTMIELGRAPSAH